MADVTTIGLVILNLALAVLLLIVCDKKDEWKSVAIAERKMRKSAEASEEKMSNGYSEMLKSYTEAVIEARVSKSEISRLQETIEKQERRIALKDRLLYGREQEGRLENA